jgi:hypothetical protein
MSAHDRRSAAFKRVAWRMDNYRHDVMFACCEIKNELGLNRQCEFLEVFSPGVNYGWVHHLGTGCFSNKEECRDWQVTALYFAAAMARTGDL